MITGRVFDIKKYSVNDGPGIRTTIFLKGCPLSCHWCHNPESQAFSAEFIYRQERCGQCGTCIEVCEAEALSLRGNSIWRDVGRCTACRSCVEACPSDAREFVGNEMTVPDVVREVLKDRVFYEESSGGVTFSGGEPLMQPDFLHALLTACGREEIHRVVDTCGFVRPEVLTRIAVETDHFLYDLKHMDPDRHRQSTGVGNERILANLRLLAELGSTLTIRVPVIPGFNNDVDSMGAVAAFLGDLGSVREVNLLPYHQIAQDKYRRFGFQIDPGLSAGGSGETSEPLSRFTGLFESFGLSARVGGE